MAKYRKIINNRPIYSDGKSVEIDGRWISNPSEAMLLKAGWVLYEPEKSLDQLKAEKINESNAYADSLRMVSLNGQDIWKTPAERDNYLSTLQSAKRLGETSIPFLGMEMSIEQGILIIDTVNLWAYRVTMTQENHAKAIEQLTSAEEVASYDFTVGYPEKLVF